MALDLRWFFREQEVSDFGIDAHVEKFNLTQGSGGNEVEDPTGQLLALQIKGGPHYFREASENGWWFRFGGKKHRYWMNHALPVIVVLVDIESKTAYWQEVGPRTVKTAGKGYKLEVPRSHDLSQADPAWSELASGLERAAHNRFDYSLSVLPPATRRLLEHRVDEEKADAALLAMHLAQGRLNGHGTVTSLQAARPAWLNRAGAWGWAAIGNYASSHELHREAGMAYAEAAELTEAGRRGVLLAAAATHIHRFDPDRARTLLAQADAEAELGRATENTTLAADRVIRAAARSLLAQPEGHASRVRGATLAELAYSGSVGTVQWALDPVLTAGGPDVDASAPAQRVLALHAEARNDFDAAVHHALAAIRLEPYSSSTKLLACRLYMTRSTEPTSHAGDVRSAVELYEAAIADRAPWSGPTREVRLDLAQALMSAGRLEEVIKLTLPVPFGTAHESDLQSECVRLGVHAAAVRGRSDTVEQATRFLGSEPADLLLQVALGTLVLPSQDVTELRLRVVDDALAKERWDEALRTALPLLRDGVDIQDRLTSLAQKGIVDDIVVELGSALLLAHHDLDSAIPKLRELAKVWNPAGQSFLALLKSAGRLREAASAAENLHQLTGNEQYLLERADVLVELSLDLQRSFETDIASTEQRTGETGEAGETAEAGEPGEPGETEDESGPENEQQAEQETELESAVAEATEACRDALAVSWLHPHDRGRLLTFLGSRAADSGDWVSAEKHTRGVLDLFEIPGDGNVWRNVVCLLNLGRYREAARTIRTYRPTARNLEEAGAWLQAHSTARWSHSLALEAWALSERFDDPRFSTAVAGQILTNTRGSGLEPDEESGDESGGQPGDESGDDSGDHDDVEDEQLRRRRELAQEMVPGELHRRALELIARISEEHPDATGVQVLRGDSTEDLIEVLVEELQRHAEFDSALEDLAHRALVGQMPIGMLAGLLGRSHATLVIQRGLGVLPASSPDDDEHYAEVEVAAAFFNRTVVVDAATVVTLAGLADSALLTGRFASLAVAPATMHDLNSAYFDVRGLAGSPGSIRWDPNRRTIATTNLSEDEYVRIFRRAEQVQAFADRLNVLTKPNRRALLAGLADDERGDSWVDALEVAHHHDVAVYSDDLSLRRLARSLDVPAFGTPALVDAIRDASLEAIPRGGGERIVAVLEQHSQLNRALVRDYLVDLVITEEELLELAEEEGWGLGAAASTVARPKWWIEHPEGIRTVFQILRHAAAAGADQAAVWQWAAMRGVASAAEPNVATRLLALLAFRGFSEDPTDEERALGLLRARDVARSLGVPDPTAAIALVTEEVEGSELGAATNEVVARVIALADRIYAESS